VVEEVDAVDAGVPLERLFMPQLFTELQWDIGEVADAGVVAADVGEVVLESDVGFFGHVRGAPAADAAPMLLRSLCRPLGAGVGVPGPTRLTTSWPAWQALRWRAARRPARPSAPARPSRRASPPAPGPARPARCRPCPAGCRRTAGCRPCPSPAPSLSSGGRPG